MNFEALDEMVRTINEETDSWIRVEAEKPEWPDHCNVVYEGGFLMHMPYRSAYEWIQGFLCGVVAHKMREL